MINLVKKEVPLTRQMSGTALFRFHKPLPTQSLRSGIVPFIHVFLCQNQAEPIYRQLPFQIGAALLSAMRVLYGIIPDLFVLVVIAQAVLEQLPAPVTQVGRVL